MISPPTNRQHEHGIAVTGTVGILLACVRQNYLSLEQANALLTAMIAAGYHSPVESLDALLRPLHIIR